MNNNNNNKLIGIAAEESKAGSIKARTFYRGANTIKNIDYHIQCIEDVKRLPGIGPSISKIIDDLLKKVGKCIHL